MVVLRRDAFKKQAYAITAELVAILQKEALMHALSGIGVFAVHLGVESLNEEAVCFALGDDLGMFGNKLQTGAVVSYFDLGEFFAEVGGLDVRVVVILLTEGAVFDVSFGTRRDCAVLSFQDVPGAGARVEELDFLLG